MPKSHERILQRIIRRFGSFPTRTYSNRNSDDASVRITYEERSGVFLTQIKRAPDLSDVSPYVGVRWQIHGRVTGAPITLQKLFFNRLRFCFPNVCEDVNAFLQHFY